MMKYILGIILVAVGALLIVTTFTGDGGGESPVVSEIPEAEIVFEETEFDFGVIKQSGGIVQHEFPFVYNGDMEREVVAVPGSCACTTAEIDVDVLKPGTRGVITISFDPNLHEEPEGRFYKTAALITDPILEDEAEVKIWTEIDLDLGPEFFKLSANNNDDDDGHSNKEYSEIHADELLARMESKDFFLLDVHIPEQDHIDGTDAFIPFTDVESRLSELPEDKTDEIVVYCRSGSMSQVAAQTLIDNGYKNVSFLEGGKTEYDNLGE
jgi:rhodanese-related sulfurtransferase